MIVKQLPWLRTIPLIGGRLHDLVKSIQDGVTAIERQTNSNASGQPQAPPSIQGLNVRAQNGHFQFEIQDQAAGLRRGVSYFIEHADNSSFANSHTIELGQTRNHNEYLGNVTRFARAYSAYPGSPVSEHVYFGDQTNPQPISGGGTNSGPAFLPSQGTGTGAAGQGGVGPGPIPERTDTSGFDWQKQQAPGLIAGLPATGTPAGSAGSGTGDEGGGGGGATVVSEPTIARAEWISTVGGTGDAITGVTAVPYSSLAAGFKALYVPINANTTAVTLNLNSIGASAVTKNGTAALVGGELVVGKAYLLLWDGTRWQIIAVIAPPSATLLASNANGVPSVAALANEKVYIGSAGNLPVAQTISGAITVTAAGLTKTAATGSVTAGSYTNADITVSADGIVTAAANGSGGGSLGTWTPDLTFGGANVGITYGFQNGNYFQVGTLIVATLDILLTSKGVSVGIAEIAGLPSSVSIVEVTGGAVQYCLNMLLLTSIPSILAEIGTTKSALYNCGATGCANLTDANFTNTSRLIATVIYSA